MFFYLSPVLYRWFLVKLKYLFSLFLYQECAFSLIVTCILSQHYTKCLHTQLLASLLLTLLYMSDLLKTFNSLVLPGLVQIWPHIIIFYLTIKLLFLIFSSGFCCSPLFLYKSHLFLKLYKNNQMHSFLKFSDQA